MTKGNLAITKGTAWGKSSITFSRAAFESTERLAISMAHELGHVTHNFLGLSALAHQKWTGMKYGESAMNNYGHAAIYNMENNFTIINNFSSLNNVATESYGYLAAEMRSLGKLSSSIDYLGKIKIK
jgi:hypothetical protein